MATISAQLKNEILKQGPLGMAMAGNPGADVATSWKLILEDNAGTDLAVFPISNFTISGGVATAVGLPLEVNAQASGTASKARLQGVKSDSTTFDLIVDMTVGNTAGYEIQMADTSITSGQPVQLTSFSITAPSNVVRG